MSVRIPPDSEKSSLVRIEGDPQGVRQAKRELLDLASRMVRPVALLGRRMPPSGASAERRPCHCRVWSWEWTSPGLLLGCCGVGGGGQWSSASATP